MFVADEDLGPVVNTASACYNKVLKLEESILQWQHYFVNKVNVWTAIVSILSLAGNLVKSS